MTASRRGLFLYDPGMSSSRATLQELFDQAIARHQGGDLAGAERLYQQVLLMEPNSFAPRHMLGVIRFQQGRAAEAIDLITGALKLNPQVAAPGSIWAMCRRRRRATKKRPPVIARRCNWCPAMPRS